MNSKGFTLVELLGCIAIIGFIATIASFNVMNIFSRADTTKMDAINKNIEDASCVYIELDKNKDLKSECIINGCSISTDDLIKEGLIERDDVLKDLVINIQYKDKEKICKIKE